MKFRFIPELIGDFSHVMELSGNPKMLYVEAAMNSLHAVTSVFAALEEHTNTESMLMTEQTLRKEYSDLEKVRNSNYEEEVIRKLDITFETLKSKVRDGKFWDKEVREFIDILKKELNRMIDIFHNMQLDPDHPERANIEEVTRKTVRAYNNLLTIYIEEDQENG